MYVENQTEKTKNASYAFARESKFLNLGEDFAGSARHIYNSNLDLAKAESENTVERLLHLDSLLITDPVNFPEITEDNHLQILTCHLCLKYFPKKSYYEKSHEGKEARKKLSKGLPILKRKNRNVSSKPYI